MSYFTGPDLFSMFDLSSFGCSFLSKHKGTEFFYRQGDKPLYVLIITRLYHHKCFFLYKNNHKRLDFPRHRSSLCFIPDPSLDSHVNEF